MSSRQGYQGRPQGPYRQERYGNRNQGYGRNQQPSGPGDRNQEQNRNQNYQNKGQQDFQNRNQQDQNRKQELQNKTQSPNKPVGADNRNQDFQNRNQTDHNKANFGKNQQIQNKPPEAGSKNQNLNSNAPVQVKTEQNSTPSVKLPVKEEPQKQPEKDKGIEECCIFVGNLPRSSVDEGAVKKTFAEHGEIKEFFMSQSKGFAFVTYNKPEEASAAIKALDGSEIGGKRIGVRHKKANKKEKPAPPQVQNVPTDNYFQEEPVKPKKSSLKCRLFVGNLPTSVTEEEFRRMFQDFGEVTEIFLQRQKGFGFVKMDNKQSAEAAKNALDNSMRENKYLQVRFANQGSAVKVKNLSSFVSNELLEHAFKEFGEVDRAVVIVDEKGRSIGEGIVEFTKRQSAQWCLRQCQRGCLLLTSSPMPVEVELLEVRDEEEGLPEKNVNKNNPRYQKERDVGPRFAELGSFEYEFANKWKQLMELEKQKKDFLDRDIMEERRRLQEEGEFIRYEHQTNCLKEQLRMLEEQNQLMAREREMRMEELKRRDEYRLQEQMMLRQREEELLGLRPREPYRAQEEAQGMRPGMDNRGGSVQQNEENFRGGMGPGQQAKDNYRGSFDSNRPSAPHELKNGPAANEGSGMKQEDGINAPKNIPAGDPVVGDKRPNYDQQYAGRFGNIQEAGGRDRIDTFRQDAKRRRY